GTPRSLAAEGCARSGPAGVLHRRAPRNPHRLPRGSGHGGGRAGGTHCPVARRLPGRHSLSPRALIAEDEPARRAEVRLALSELWPELVICAEVGDGIEATRVLEEQRPEILFLDVAMPGMDGLEVARRASGRSHVVFITAYNEHAIPAFEEGAIDF